MKSNERLALLEYISLCEDFLAEKISGDEFRDAYFKLSRADKNRYEDEEVGRLIDWIYPEIDVYEPDPQLLKTLQEEKPNWYLGDDEVRRKVMEFVSKIKLLVRANP